MLFEHLLGPGDRVVVEQPTYDRTLLLLQRLGVELVPVPLEDDGLDLGAFEAALAEGPIEARPRDPQLPQPGRLHALGREARAPGRARRRARLLDLRGRPLPRAALRGRGAGDDALARRAPAASSTPPPSRRRSAPASGSATSPGPAAEIAEAGQTRQRDLHLAEHAGRVVVLELCRSGGLDRNIEFVKGALNERRDALVAALGRADPRGRVRRPRGRLLPLARPRRGHRHERPAGRGQGRAASPSSPAPTS